MSSVTSLNSLLNQDEWKFEEIQRLLEKDNFSSIKRNNDGDAPLHVVLKNKNCSVDVVQLLLTYGADINAEDYCEKSPLRIALEYCRDDAVIMTLIEEGACKYFGQSCLCMALRYKASKNVIQLLLDTRFSLNACRDHGSVLHCATFGAQSISNLEVIKMIIERGANVNAVDNQGRNVLCSALRNGKEGRFIQLLLEAGGSLNGCRNHDNFIMCATEYGHGNYLKTSVVQMLLEAGVSMHQVDICGNTTLECALRWCKYETNAIALLLDCHKVMNFNSGQLADLLHLAVHNPNCELSAVKLLVQRGLPVDKSDLKGFTPLKIAVKNPECQLSVVQYLLKKGAKVTAQIMEIALERFFDVKIFKLLLAASPPISYSSFHYMLRIVLNQLICHSHRLACFRFLLRVYFLQVSNYSIPYLTFDRHHQQFFRKMLNFRRLCVVEILKMKSKIVGRGRTLHDFLSGCHSPSQHPSDQEGEEKMYDFDQLLEVISNNAFPLYFEIIADKVGRPPMMAKLGEVTMSAPKYSPTNASKEEIVIPYECVLKITDYLEEEDLLRCLLALTNVDDGTHVNRAKRKAEQL